MKRTMLLALLAALTFIACKKDKSPAPDPLTTGTWRGYAFWGGASPGSWQPMLAGQSMIFKTNGMYEMNNAGDPIRIFTGGWQRVTDKPADVPAEAHMVQLHPDAYVTMKTFLLITFLTADEIRVEPYVLPADRPLVNPVGPIKYKRH
jgi:hypothetical protein